MIRTAAFQEAVKDRFIRCCLCPHGCVLKDGQDGLCRVRGVRNGELKALAYGIVSAANMDPIEKKPLYHFYPGREILSIGGWGCNLRCSFCQNCNISQQQSPGGAGQGPDDIVSAALHHDSIGVAYTYNEPLVSIEFVMDCARAVHEAGLVNVLVTNGFITSKAGAALLESIDALNIDIKSMEDAFYSGQCGGRLQPVLDFASAAAAAGRHIEVTNLIIPGQNDSQSQMRALTSWIVDSLGDRTPLHLSAYYPRYKMQIPPTSSADLLAAYETCREEMSYVYIGNLRTESGQNTCCPSCGTLLLERHGYRTALPGVERGKCASCGRGVDAIGL